LQASAFPAPTLLLRLVNEADCEEAAADLTAAALNVDWRHRVALPVTASLQRTQEEERVTSRYRMPGEGGSWIDLRRAVHGQAL
jgi:hypothetical protein